MSVGASPSAVRSRRALVLAVVIAAVWGGGAGSALATPSSLAWSTPQSIDTHALLAIRCPAASLCVAIDRAGNVLTSRSPRIGAAGWKRAHVDNGLTALACPSTTLCVAVDSNGNVLTSRSPAGGGKTWSKTLVDTVSPGELSAVGCRSNLCIVGDNQGNAFSSTNPTGGRHAWKLISLPSNGDSPGILTGFSCPLRSLCVGVDQSTGEGFIDDVYTSTQPTAPNKWNLTTEFNNNSFNGVACPAKSLCVAPTDTGEVVTATNPTRASSWRATALANVSINAVACSSVSFCILGDDSGRVHTSTNPAGGAGTWVSQDVAMDAIQTLACASSRLCIAGTFKGEVLVGVR